MAHHRRRGDGELGESATAASFFLVLGAIVCALLLIVGVMQAKSTVYTLTNRRVAMRIGAALTMTLNLPFRKIQSTPISGRPQERHGHHRAGDDAGGPGEFRLSYVMTWPHVRPWRMKHPEPALRCIPDAAKVAKIFAEAAETAVSQPVIEVVAKDGPTAQPVAAE
jgi:hypothetical protein